jgi:hypothetical protein
VSSSRGLLEGGDALKRLSLDRVVGDDAGSIGKMVGAGAAGVEGCLGKRLERKLDLLNGLLVDDFLSGVVIGDWAEIEGFVVLS